MVWTLTVLGAPVGIVLGVLALRRVRDRPGRWAAHVAVWLGVAVIVLSVLAITGGYLLGRYVFLSVDDLRTGQCIGLDQSSEHDDLTFSRQPCSDGHEAEVAATGRLDRAGLAALRSDSAARFCLDRLTPAYAERVRRPRLALTVVVGEHDPAEAQLDTTWACLVRTASGDPLGEHVLGGATR